MHREACMICHYNQSPLELYTLERLVNYLSNIVDPAQVVNPNHYNWYKPSSFKCRYGMSCSKTNHVDTTFNRVTSELNILLTAYLEQTDCEDYYEILQYLRGTYANVYREFEIEVRKKID